MSSLRVTRAELERCGGAMPGVTTAVATWTERRGLLVRLVDEAGRVGVGEASPLPGYSPDDLDAAGRALERATARPLELSEGDELDGITALGARVDTAAPSARFALETALVDLLAQRRGCSVAAVLAGGVPAADEMPCTALVAEAADASEARGCGAGALKLKIGLDWERDLARVRAVRAAAPELPLRVDVNGRWHTADLASRLAALAEAGVELVEQPLAPDQMQAIAASPVPIAADESLRSAAGRAALAPLIAAGALGAYVLKPAVLGGLSACLALATEARAAGADVIVSHLFDGPVALAVCAELACALGGPRAAGLDRHPGLSAWPLPAPPQLDGGRVRSVGPGLVPELEESGP